MLLCKEKMALFQNPFVLRAPENFIGAGDDPQEYVDNFSNPSKPNVINTQVLADWNREEFLTVQVSGLSADMYFDIFSYLDSDSIRWPLSHDGHENSIRPPPLIDSESNATHEAETMHVKMSLSEMEEFEAGVLNCHDLELDTDMPGFIWCIPPFACSMQFID
jgi:hypothetical protein